MSMSDHHKSKGDLYLPVCAVHQCLVTLRLFFIRNHILKESRAPTIWANTCFCPNCITCLSHFLEGFLWVIPHAKVFVTNVSRTWRSQSIESTAHSLPDKELSQAIANLFPVYVILAILINILINSFWKWIRIIFFLEIRRLLAQLESLVMITYSRLHSHLENQF